MLMITAILGFVGTYAILSVDKTEKEHLVFIPERSSTEEVARILQTQNIIAFETPFTIASYINAMNGRYIQPGEYEIDQGMNAHKVLKKLLSGKRYVRKIIVPEGFTVFQVRQTISTSDGLIGKIWGYISEGYLMPDTYHYFHGTTKSSIIARMKDEIQEYLDEQTKDLPQNPLLPGYHEILTLASIVEKEAMHDDERAIVASVYLNRLKMGMPLQADPTVIYGLKDGLTDFDYVLSSKDLKTESPYNTYLNKGLPPNPICNPGRKSIEAVLHPADTNYLYFVADGETGGHNFSKTYREHKINVRSYKANR